MVNLLISAEWASGYSPQAGDRRCLLD